MSEHISDGTTADAVHGNHELLISYLYDECESQERARVDAHLAECTGCAAEIEALSGTRRELAGWAPPEVALGFQITRPQPAAVASARVLRPERWWSRPMPAWAQAAAAMLIFGAGLSLGGGVNSYVERERAASQPMAASPDASQDRAVAPQVTTAPAEDMVAEVSRLREELAQLRQARTVAPATPQPVDQDALIERVRTLIDESEQRQRTEFTLRSAQLVRDVEMQRRADLTRVERTIGLVQGQTGAEVRQNREALNYLGRMVATGNR
jgi:anti-sigma factor RsiW